MSTPPDQTDAAGSQIRPVPRAGVLDITAYVPGIAGQGAAPVIHMLASNENPLGTSDAAKKAFHDVAETLHEYPDPAANPLKEAIRETYGLAPENIVVGNGSDELISLLAQAYTTRGDEILYSAHGFLMYRIAALSAGATPVAVPETADLHFDVDAVLSAVTDRTRIVFIANPNNPTGTYIPSSEVRRLHAGLPPNVILAIDAAYAEYVQDNDYESGIELVSSSSNTVMLRTFSKMYGLAGLRLGWMYGPDHICDIFNRVRGAFNVNMAACAAGAAAMRDKAFVANAISHNGQWLPWLTSELRALGVGVTPSVGNFVLAHFPDEDGKRAADVFENLRSQGILTRRMGGYGFPNALRISLGTEDGNRAVIDALRTLFARN